MDIERFKNSPVGRLVAIKGEDALGRPYDHFAFVPSPLPERIKLSDDTWDLVARAGVALGRLDGEGNRLPKPSTLARPQIRTEAVSSAALEGTYTTLPQVLQGELLEEDRSDDINEVLDHIRAAELGFNVVGEGQPLGINLIKELHRQLMATDRKCSPNEKGEFRDRQNFIGPHPDSTIEESWFVPPPPTEEDLMQGIYEWEKWIHDERINILVRLAVGHYQFEALHPFVDGNGRIGRLVVVLLLLHEATLTVPLLNLSPYLQDHRTEYQEHLREVSATGNFDPWVAFFSEAVRVQSVAGLEKIHRLLNFKDTILSDLWSRRIRGLATKIAEDLIGYPVVTPTDVRDRYEVSYQAAKNAIASLEGAGHVTQLQATGSRKVFASMAALEILHSR